MNVPVIFRRAAGYVSKNSVAILTGAEIVGFFSTVGFAVVATRRADLIIDRLNEDYLNDPREGIDPPTKMDVFKQVAPVYIPTVIMGVLTLACMIGSKKISSRQNAVLASLYSTSQMALKEYQDKVVERFGEKEERQVRDDVARARLEKHPIQDNQVIITGKGEHLCFEPLSGRYFKSDIEKIRRVVNDVNHDIVSDMYMYKSLNDFYGELGLPPIELGDDQGWNIDHRMDIDFSSHLTTDGTPCLSIDYLEPPRADYRVRL